MAIRYYDTNGATAGFGTWNATTWGANWSSSAAGNVATGTFAFTAADEAWFGSDTTAGSSGTITLNSAVTIGAIRARQLAGDTTIQGSGSLALGGTQGIIDTTQGNIFLYWNLPVTGTAGLRKVGAGGAMLGGTTTGLSGTISVEGGFLDLITSANTTFFAASGTTIAINGGQLFLQPRANNITLTVNGNFSGGANLQLQGDFGGGSPTTKLVVLNGTVKDLNAANAYADGGLKLNDLPYGSMTWFSYNGSSNAITVRYPTAAYPTPASVATFFNFQALNSIGSPTYTFNSGEAAGQQSFVSSGYFQRGDTFANVLTIVFGGTVGGTINGNGLHAGTGIVNFSKTGASTWVLGGNNNAVLTSTGTFSVADGPLRATNSAAFGNGSASITMSNAAAAVELANNITIARNISAQGIIRNVSDSNTLSGSVTLTQALTINVAGGTLTHTGAFNSSTFAATFSGAGNFVKNGSGGLQVAASGGFTGAFTQSQGNVYCGSTFNFNGVSANGFKDASAIQVASGLQFWLFNSNNAGFTVAGPVSGGGDVILTNASDRTEATGAITFNDLSGFTGFFVLWNNQEASNARSFAIVKKLPASGTIRYQIGAGAISSGFQKVITIPSDGTASTTAAAIDIRLDNNFAITNTLFALNASQSTGAMTFNGPVTRNDGASGYSVGPQTFTLGGTNANLNTINGVISSTAGHGALAIAKTGTGRWVLNGTNTYTGGTTISDGPLRATNSSAFGTNPVMFGNSSGVLEIDGGITLANNINPSGTSGGNIRVLSGSNTLTGTLFLPAGTTTTIDVQGGSLTISGQISGSGTLAATGIGTLNLTNPNNSQSGPVTLKPSETLAVSNLAVLGTGTTLTMEGDAVLQYTGNTSAVLSRNLTAVDFSGGFTNSGNASFAVTGGSGGVTGGSNVKLDASAGVGPAQFNVFGASVASAGSFTKTGSGRWITTAANNLNGFSYANVGTLMAANAAGAGSSRLLGAGIRVLAGARIQLSSDNGQAGKNNYLNLFVEGTAGNRSKIRIGGSAVNPVIQLNGNLTLPTTGQTLFDLSADVFKTVGTYTLIEFVDSFGVTGGNASNITAGGTLSPGLQAAFTIVAGSPNRIDVTISKIP